MNHFGKSWTRVAFPWFGNAVNPSMGAPAAPSMARTVPNQGNATHAHDLDEGGPDRRALSI
jgi:hypothetical protein